MRAAVTALAVIGCSSDKPFCVEQYVTVDQGVYGQVIEACDTGGCSGEPAGIPGIAINIWDEARQTLVAQGRSDSLGMFQFPLDLGSYMACTAEASFPSCTTFEVGAGAQLASLRLMKPIGGWFLANPSKCAE